MNAKYDVYIGRPSKWGNPYIVNHHGTRDQVIGMYINWLVARPHLIEQAKIELKDKILGCWCAPKPCHGDVLAEFVNKQED